MAKIKDFIFRPPLSIARTSAHARRRFLLRNGASGPRRRDWRPEAPGPRTVAVLWRLCAKFQLRNRESGCRRNGKLSARASRRGCHFSEAPRPIRIGGPKGDGPTSGRAIREEAGPAHDARRLSRRAHSSTVQETGRQAAPTCRRCKREIRAGARRIPHRRAARNWTIGRTNPDALGCQRGTKASGVRGLRPAHEVPAAEPCIGFPT
jgi:hypothetical protein